MTTRAPVRLGDLLVARSLLTEAQRDEILQIQHRRARPFGALAEEMFGVSPKHIEEAWGVQFAEHAPRLDPLKQTVHPMTRALIDKRQAWQFVVIPTRFDGKELVCITTPEALARAMRFTGWKVDRPCQFAVCDLELMQKGLDRHYPLHGAPGEIRESIAQLAALAKAS